MAFLLSNLLAACKIKPQSENKLQIVSDKPMVSTTETMTKNNIHNEKAEGLICRILEIHRQLEARGADNLKPCEEVNDLFIELVGICIQTISDTMTNKVLNDPRIISILPSLHILCGIAECHLESHWARQISGDSSSTSSQVQDRLSKFPYYSNYIDLTRMELSALNSLLTPTSRPLRKFAFIGSGPLPLTSLCISQTASYFNHPDRTTICDGDDKVEVLNIDINPHAISESSQLCDLLGHSAIGMKFQCSPADTPDLDLSTFDVVYLAALVGSTQAEKEVLLKSVVGRMREGAYLVVRSAERLRQLLYAEFDPTTEKVLSCLDVCLAVHPYNHVVNSVIIGKVRNRMSSKESR